MKTLTDSDSAEYRKEKT